jgi:SAM-dependent methyltransferase
MICVGVPLEPIARAHREVGDEHDRVAGTVRAAVLTISALTVWQHKLAGYPDSVTVQSPYGAVMNADHENLCSSPEWAAYLQDELLPTLLDKVDLGRSMLELGPGPGAATSWLGSRVDHLTAVELDPAAADLLAAKLAGTNVTVLTGEVTTLELEAESFDSVGSFTMLHHVPTWPQQFAILAETYRVLRPGGVFVGSDSLATVALHDFHADDTYNPVDPARLLVSLQALGFARITVGINETLTFTATKASPDDERECS